MSLYSEFASGASLASSAVRSESGRTPNLELSVLIVDDEPIARARIKRLLQGDAQVKIVGSCSSVSQCERLDVSILPDLVFLDVRMPQRDGFDLLESYRARGINPLVIFVTAYSRHAIRAYDAGAIDYLLKPFDDARFAKALARAKAVLDLHRSKGDLPARAGPAAADQRPGPDRLLVSEDGRTLLIETRDIELVQVTGKHVKIFVRQRCYLTRQSLTSVEARLGKQYFVRVHRSTIISVEQILAFRPLPHGDCEIILKRGTRVTLSRRFRRRLKPFLEKSCGFDGTGEGFRFSSSPVL
jgi:two-component system, LytTR family, response regulator